MQGYAAPARAMPLIIIGRLYISSALSCKSTLCRSAESDIEVSEVKDWPENRMWGKKGLLKDTAPNRRWSWRSYDTTFDSLPGQSIHSNFYNKVGTRPKSAPLVC